MWSVNSYLQADQGFHNINGANSRGYTWIPALVRVTCLLVLLMIFALNFHIDHMPGLSQRLNLIITLREKGKELGFFIRIITKFVHVK